MADIETVTSNRWRAHFNEKHLTAVKSKRQQPNGRTSEVLEVTDTVTGKKLEGAELRSFTSLLNFHVQQRVSKTTIPTVRTMNQAEGVTHD